MKETEILSKAESLRAGSRVALAAFLHDLGKFAERARIEVDKDRLDSHVSQYCPFRQRQGYHSHRHAAYTALAWDLLERRFPELIGDDVAPFAAWNDPDVDDSVVNAAARHHRPETFLQWIVATADRVASGFEREKFAAYNQARDETRKGRTHYTARQLTLFEQIDLGDTLHRPARGELRYRYPLRPLSVDALFPVAAGGYETSNERQAQREYAELWQAFISGLERIPASHRADWPLWLDHLDSAWACYTQAIPSATAFGTRPEVSLYDHSCAVAAVATSLWRYHHDRGDDPEQVRKRLSDFDRPDWDEQKLLLVQGDFFGIQEFLFATGGETQKRAARLLRGRSFYVSLLTECAALAILDELALPPTSQVINAAGKFLIVAPNTEAARETLRQVQKRLDDWFLAHAHGQAGIGIAWIGASCNDFLDDGKEGGRSRFGQLIDRLFDALGDAKARRFGLCGEDAPAPVFEAFLDRFDNDLGVCAIDGRSPATHRLDGSDTAVSDLAADQIAIGRQLAHRERILITRDPLGRDTLRVPIFGYRVTFTSGEESSGKFGPLARAGKLLRAWDYRLPEEADAPLFNGYARRNINGHVPLFGELNAWERSRYDHLDEPVDGKDPQEPKTFEFIACDDRSLTEHGKWLGVSALTTLKGDVDDLGAIFERGLQRPTFAKMAALSRQMNDFFALWLPWFASKNHPSTYTVFAGGDDFFLIGPWRGTLRLAREMREKFTGYVAHNPQIHFSAGLAMTKPGMPVRQMGERAEQALDAAKERRGDDGTLRKDGVTCFGHTVGWDDFAELLEHALELDRERAGLRLSTGYLYGLQDLADMAEDLRRARDPRHIPKIESALWHSRFSYRTARMLEQRRGLDREARRRLQQELSTFVGGAINRHGAAYKIALFAHLYQLRN